MTAATHTPGPWAVDTIEPDTIVPAADTELSICVVSCVDEGGAKGWYRGDVTSANVRLIAAAPELLEALSALVDMCYSNGERWVPPMEFIETARLAIAKATRGQS